MGVDGYLGIFSKSMLNAIEWIVGIPLSNINPDHVKSDGEKWGKVQGITRGGLIPSVLGVIRAIPAAVDGRTAARFVAQTGPLVSANPFVLEQLATLTSRE